MEMDTRNNLPVEDQEHYQFCKTCKANYDRRLLCQVMHHALGECLIGKPPATITGMGNGRPWTAEEQRTFEERPLRSRQALN